MRLGYFGGSFDPPHCGHLAIAQAAAQSFALDRIWLAPTGRQPLKRMGAEASFADRVAMTQLLCEGDNRLLASEIDAPHADGTPNYTVDALLGIRAQIKDDALFAVIGADALPDLPRWRESDRLFELASWIVVSRPGHLLAGAVPASLRMQQERGRLCFLEGPAVPVSSSEIRQTLRRGNDPTHDEIPEAVLRYVRSHRLYAERLETASPLEI